MIKLLASSAKLMMSVVKVTVSLSMVWGEPGVQLLEGGLQGTSRTVYLIFSWLMMETEPLASPQSHLLLLMLLVFEATVYRHQAHHYRQLQKSPPTIPTLFATATRDTLDQGLIPCLKYLLNYTFYKFGLEVCGDGSNPHGDVCSRSSHLRTPNTGSISTDLLPDDGECDWPEDELPDDNPRLLAGGHLVQAPAGGYCQALAQLLRLPVRLYDLPVPVVFRRPARSLHR